VSTLVSPLASATTPMRPFRANATREPSGDTRGSLAGSLPKVSRRSPSSERRRQ